MRDLSRRSFIFGSAAALALFATKIPSAFATLPETDGRLIERIALANYGARSGTMTVAINGMPFFTMPMQPDGLVFWESPFCGVLLRNQDVLQLSADCGGGHVYLTVRDIKSDMLTVERFDFTEDSPLGKHTETLKIHNPRRKT